MTETLSAQCLRCGLLAERDVPLDEGSDTQQAEDTCARCGSHDVRSWSSEP